MRRRASDGKFNFGQELSYDANNALNQAQQLLVASFAVTLPSLFADMQHVTLEHVIVLSRAVSLFIVISYVALVTHQLVSQISKDTGLHSEVSKSSAFSVLALATILCTLSSEALVEAVSGFAQESGYSKTFVGVVVLPIAGDLTHVSAVYMAMKGKMELATSIALSSSIQVAMVVLPIAVFMGYLMDQPMTLNLRAMHSVCLVVSAVITFAVMVDGKSNWLRGYTLLTTFFMIALIVFFQPDLGE
jgi:Ca2+:H+ antiporter